MTRGLLHGKERRTFGVKLSIKPLVSLFRLPCVTPEPEDAAPIEEKDDCGPGTTVNPLSSAEETHVKGPTGKTPVHVVVTDLRLGED